MLQAPGYKIQAISHSPQGRGGKMQSYKDLEIYQVSHKLAVEIHKMTLTELPKFEIYEQGSQIRRSSKSIVISLVEGFGRKRYQQEFIKYLTYAIASCDETKEHLELLFETGSFNDKEKFTRLLSEYEDLGKKLYRFRETVETDLKLET
jgi:four helix bundle protein